MHTITTRGLAFGILVAAIAFGGARSGRAEQTTSQDVLSALLVEVRGLRAAMEQIAVAGPSVQLGLGRLQLQEQRIANQIRRLDAVRDALVDAQSGLEPLEREVREMEDHLRAVSSDGSRDRRIAEENWKDQKANAVRRRAEVQRLTNEEMLLTQDIAAEQNRWTEVNQRLEQLERSLARVR